MARLHDMLEEGARGVRLAEEGVRLAEDHLRRVRAHKEAIREAVLSAVSTGAGQDAAALMPFATLWFYDGAWEVRPGGFYDTAEREAAHLARVLGCRVELGFNDRTIVGEP